MIKQNNVSRTISVKRGYAASPQFVLSDEECLAPKFDRWSEFKRLMQNRTGEYHIHHTIQCTDLYLLYYCLFAIFLCTNTNTRICFPNIRNRRRSISKLTNYQPVMLRWSPSPDSTRLQSNSLSYLKILKHLFFAPRTETSSFCSVLFIFLIAINNCFSFWFIL